MPGKKTAHCPICSKEIALSRKGLLMPHQVENRVCIGSGFRPINGTSEWAEERKVLADKFSRH